MGLHEPVEDWATDFDHTDDVWAADPYPIWDELRGTCPVAHTTRYGGAWLPTRYDDVAAIAYDTEHFSSRSVVVSEFRPPREFAPAGIAPPISSDPPFHQDARRMILPIFSPQSIAKLEASTRAYCEELIVGLRGHDVVDAVRVRAGRRVLRRLHARAAVVEHERRAQVGTVAVRRADVVEPSANRDPALGRPLDVAVRVRPALREVLGRPDVERPGGGRRGTGAGEHEPREEGGGNERPSHRQH